jgi:hypothetical protein
VLAEESRIKRNPRFQDNRVHALLYFIPPSGHALREMDIELMRRLSPRVNVIPIIGKADTLTPGELRGFKKRIMEDIEHYDIPIYNFPYDIEDDDEETVQDNAELRAMLPFAIVGSEEEIEIDGEPVRARIYPWGIVEVDNPKHSDFSRLRTALLNTHLADLKSLTHDLMYETYRTEKLSRSVNNEGESSILPEEMATQSVRLKEEQLRREEEKLREIELKVQREINEKRQELLAKEESLRCVRPQRGRPACGADVCSQQPRDPPRCAGQPRAGLSAVVDDGKRLASTDIPTLVREPVVHLVCWYLILTRIVRVMGCNEGEFSFGTTSSRGAVYSYTTLFSDRAAQPACNCPSTPPVDMTSPASPGARQTLIRALDLARQAVEIDGRIDDSHGAIITYARRSVAALLSKVMQRIMPGKDSTGTGLGRRRSVVAQEEEIRRL